MYVIIGLGNPGKKYENTRHNMGFKVIDILSEKLNISVDKLKFRALVGEGRIGAEKVLLVKPQTFMNLSGEAVREIVNFYKVDSNQIIVIYDDLDLDMGTFRVRAKGSAGTHNGMRNIVQHLGTTDFPRIRVGIGKERRSDIIDFVIGNVSKAELELFQSSLESAANAAVSIIDEGIDKAMNKFNVRPKKEVTKVEQD